MCRLQLPDWEHDIIFVDDGSQDDSFAHLAALHRQHGDVEAIRFVANYGTHCVVRWAGACDGDAARFLACDLQDPPEVIPAMLEKLVDPVEVVWAVRWCADILADADGLSPLPVAGSAAGEPEYSRLRIEHGVAGVRSAEAACTLRRCQMFRSREVLLATMGFPHAYVSYERQSRQSGKSKWTLAKKVKLLVDSIVSFSYVPIRVMSVLGSDGRLADSFTRRSSLWAGYGLGRRRNGLCRVMTVLLVGQEVILLCWASWANTCGGPLTKRAAAPGTSLRKSATPTARPPEADQQRETHHDSHCRYWGRLLGPEPDPQFRGLPQTETCGRVRQGPEAAGQGAGAVPGVEGVESAEAVLARRTSTPWPSPRRSAPTGRWPGRPRAGKHVLVEKPLAARPRGRRAGPHRQGGRPDR